MIYTRTMLRCAHKDLLLQIARQHARDLHASLTLARAARSPMHPDVLAIQERLELAEETVRLLENEPVRAAA